MLAFLGFEWPLGQEIVVVYLFIGAALSLGFLKDLRDDKDLRGKVWASCLFFIIFVLISPIAVAICYIRCVAKGGVFDIEYDETKRDGT